jgi:hypothetical protein
MAQEHSPAADDVGKAGDAGYSPDPGDYPDLEIRGEQLEVVAVPAD